MSDKPPFDPVKYGLWLVAAVMGLWAVVILGHMATCVFLFSAIEAGHWTCDANNRIPDLLQSLLTAVLAFVAGLMRK